MSASVWRSFMSSGDAEDGPPRDVALLRSARTEAKVAAGGTATFEGSTGTGKPSHGDGVVMGVATAKP